MKNKLILFLIAGVILSFSSLQAEEGVTPQKITFGSVLALKGKAQGLGQGMKDGLDAAFNGQKIKGRAIELLYENDFYEPPKAVEGTNALIQKGVFLMIGNVGTPTAGATLPILAEHNVPAVGFFTGAGLLRPAKGPAVNYRASYIQETAAVISEGIANGLNPSQVCAYVQNDAYGMSGITGVKLAMQKANAPKNMLDAYDAILNLTGDEPERNNIGPVGVYVRNTNEVRPGYDSLKAWEKKSGNKCKLVVTVGAYGNIAHFARHANAVNNEGWIVSAVSFTGADNFREDLEKYKATDRIIMTQVVPLLDSNLAIVKEAKSALGANFGFVSLEGYIVGKMTLKIFENMPGDLTRKGFLDQARKSKFDLGGIKIDFTGNGYQGSDLVVPSYLTASGYLPVDAAVWKKMLN
ncbi:MAG: ABC transporter substrate-binding protein [SAR324 cluster bacterium]|nr:ABC transporter substrate-binding protein [SAR324 cluster bacterium]